MKVNIFGLGYVGSVVCACLGNDGHEVTGIDVDQTKVDSINDGKSPIVEPELGERIERAVRAGQLRAITQVRTLGDISFVCVGTPSNDNGSFGLSQIATVVEQIAQLLRTTNSFHVVNIRSTILPGTVEGTIIPLLERVSEKRAGRDFGVTVNPEFMRETTAVYDYYNPPLTVIGANDEKSANMVAALYQKIDAPVENCSIRTAEMIKYACNSFHAVKVTFANEIGNFCKALGVDSHRVMEIVCKDTKLNLSPYYMKPGFAFGGSCLPKDLRAMLYESKMKDLELPMLNAIFTSNRLQIERAVNEVKKAGKNKVGVLGLSFKAGTDDLRESPIVSLIETLIGKGYSVSIYDEEVSLAKIRGANKRYIEHSIPHISSLLKQNVDEVISESEVLVVAKRGKLLGQKVMGLNHGTVVIDLVRLFADGTALPENYQGICW